MQGSLKVTVDGALATGGRLALSELARIAGELQAQLERIARVLGGGDVRTGRRPTDIVDATRLDLVGFRDGSAVLEIEPHEQDPTLFPSLLDESLSALLDGIEVLAATPSELPRGFDRSVIRGLRDLTGSLGHAVTSIRIDQPGRRPVVVDHTVKQAVRVHLNDGLVEELVVSGRLHMGDFAPSALRCRIDTAQGPVTCDFDAELRDEVLGAMDRLVIARGQAERWPHGIRVLHLEAVEPAQEAGHRSIEELVAEQGVRPITAASELVGEPVDDFDEYLTAIRSLRSA